MINDVTDETIIITMGSHEQPLFCHLVRIGSYQAVAAEQLLAAEQHLAAGTAVTSSHPNVVLYKDGLELLLKGLPKLVLHQNDIR